MKTIYEFKTAQPQYDLVHFWKVCDNGTIYTRSMMGEISSGRWVKWGNFKPECKDLLSASIKFAESKKGRFE